MTLAAERVSLRVAGRDHAGWTRVRVARSLEQAASSFELAFTPREPGGTRPGRIRPGSTCEVRLGRDRVITGVVDTVRIRVDARSIEMVATGRSRTADLVDCSAVATGGQWRGQKIERIAQILADTYEVAVVTGEGVDTGPVIPSHVLQDGENVHASIERMARLRALLVTDDHLGRLVLTRASTTLSDTALEIPGNVEALEVLADASQVYSEYRCRGQRAGSDHDFGAPIAHATGTATDAGLGRTRILVVTAEGQADAARCAERARWEAAARLGRSLEVVATVSGWRRGDGTLWQTNELVRVRADVAGIDGELLVAGVTYDLDEAGSRTTLALAPPAAYEPQAAVTSKARKASTIWAELAGGV